MYRILVVDDEAIIREGIKCLFDYEQLGFTICGEAATGEQAYSQILSLQPDVVLMDIRMPGMSGLDVVKKVRREGFAGKIVIVSSYTDFSYAQEAMRQGVQHYVTKPIDEDELEQILREFKTSLDQAQLAITTSRHYRQKARYSIIRDVLQGEADFSQLHLQDLHLEADSYQVVIVDRYHHAAPDPQRCFEELLCIPNHDSCAFDHILLHGSLVYLLKGSAVCHRFQERLAHCQEDAHSPLPNLFIALGRSVSSVNDIHLSYRDAAQLLGRRFFSRQHSHIMDNTMLEHLDSPQPFISNEHLQEFSGKLLGCIQSFNRQQLSETVNLLQFQLCHSSDTVDSAKLFLAALYLQIKNQMNHLYPNDSVAFSANADIIASIEQSSYLHEIIELFMQQFEAIMSAIGTSTRDSVLDEILNYIQHNYANNITLEDISQLFGYNRSYLGKIFSKKMGQNFNSYIDQVRIEKSKELLLSDDSKVYSIAARVGYKNVDYFHIKFKKYVGISPAEYRKQHKTNTPLCSPAGNTEKGPLF